MHQHRLYYAVAASLQIWSVGLKADGAFGDDAEIELTVPRRSGPTEISKIAFDDQGRMFLAERPAPTGAFDLEVLAVPAIGRVLRYRRSSARRRAAGASGRSSRTSMRSALPAQFRNGNGGVDFGYNYDRDGEIDCSVVRRLHVVDRRGFAQSRRRGSRSQRLAQTGPLDLHGLQGDGVWQDRPRNAPPL